MSEPLAIWPADARYMMPLLLDMRHHLGGRLSLHDSSTMAAHTLSCQHRAHTPACRRRHARLPLPIAFIGGGVNVMSA